jgi:hypothetical protein
MIFSGRPMDWENLETPSSTHFFARFAGEIVVHHKGGRPAREQRVAVTALTARSADDRVHAETLREPLSLVDVPASTQRKINFLQRHEVCLLRTDHFKDSVKVVAAAPSKAAVDVISHGT